MSQVAAHRVVGQDSDELARRLVAVEQVESRSGHSATWLIELLENVPKLGHGDGRLARLAVRLQTSDERAPVLGRLPRTLGGRQDHGPTRQQPRRGLVVIADQGKRPRVVALGGQNVDRQGALAGESQAVDGWFAQPVGQFACTGSRGCVEGGRVVMGHDVGPFPPASAGLALEPCGQRGVLVRSRRAR